MLDNGRVAALGRQRANTRFGAQIVLTRARQLIH